MSATAVGGSRTGTAPLLRTLAKHEGRNFAPWIGFVTILSASASLIYPWVFPHQADREALAVAVKANPALSLIFGPAFDLSTTDGFNAWRSLAIGGFLLALGAIFTVVRTTRGQEDSGQAELLASGVMGRAARLMSGVGLAVVGSLVAGIVSTVVTGLCGGNWADSLLLNATFVASGWMFAGVAAISAQLGADARAANTMAVTTLGGLFILRGFAYAMDAPAWTIWANPLGWLTETRPATGNHWWPLLLALAFALVAIRIAFVLQSRRDFGQGIIAPKPGPARGRTRSTLQLARRLNAGPLVTWAVAFAVIGVAFGYFTTSIQDILTQDAAVAQILAAGAATPDELIGAFLVTIFSLIGIIAAIPGIQIVVKVYREEVEDRVEPVLAGAVSRQRFYASNVLLAFLAPVIYILIAGLVIAWLAASADIGVQMGDVVVQALATIPASWTITAVAVAVIGARPVVSLAAWFGVLVAFVLTLLGPIFKLWDWILGISPFWHVPNVMEDPVDWTGLGWISLVTVLFLLVGFAGFRRRDLARQ